jgi:3-deoxy-D-manno-octulosonic acid (KDO) 8-phosphate synthase
LLESNEDKTRTCKSLWDTAKEVVRVKFVAKSAYDKKSERSQVNNVVKHLSSMWETLEPISHTQK